MKSSSRTFGSPFHTAPRASLGAAALLSCAAAFTAAAQQVAAPANAPPAAPQQESVTEELIRMLAQHNALSQADAETLLKRLQAEKSASTQPAVSQPASAEAGSAAAAQGNKGDVHVIYVPESQKQKMRDEIKQEVLATAKAENWAQPNGMPEWIKRISFSGDFRFRNEWDLFDSTNDSFINYQAINTGSPYDVNALNSLSTLTPPPTLDTNQDRERPRLRARIAMDAKVSDELTADFRFSTGNDNNPVSTDQTLGGEGSASSGDFNRPVFYFDRAYLEYRPLPGVEAWAGRMPDPWFAPTNLAWYQDLAFDGVAGSYTWQTRGGFAPFATLGAFSVENTSLNFPSTGTAGSGGKVASRDKWLYAGQIGLNYALTPQLSLKQAIAYYYFSHLNGQVSSACQAYSASDACDSDVSRPGFMQKGNTLFELRDLLPNPNITNPNAAPQYQYFGLSAPFHELDAAVQLDQALDGPIHLIFSGEAAVNLGYNRNRVLSLGPPTSIGPVNNFDPCPLKPPPSGCSGPYHAGNVGWQAQLLGGYPTIRERGEWRLVGGYRYLESDAVVDAFTDSDFHLGGTNAKGYYLFGALGFVHNAWFEAKWFSSREVSGPPLAIDVMQLDLNARF